MMHSRRDGLWPRLYEARNSTFIFAMSTPVGHSRLQPLHETHRSSVLNISSDVNASGPSCPEIASRSVFARPRVRCCSSRVTRYDGHMVPASNLRQWPLLLHISTALSKPPHSLQSSTVRIFSAL